MADNREIARQLRALADQLDPPLPPGADAVIRAQAPMLEWLVGPDRDSIASAHFHDEATDFHRYYRAALVDDELGAWEASSRYALGRPHNPLDPGRLHLSREAAMARCQAAFAEDWTCHQLRQIGR